MRNRVLNAAVDFDSIRQRFLQGPYRGLLSALACGAFWFAAATTAKGIPRVAQPAEGSGTTLAAGTLLYVRLDTPVSTKTSHLHQAVAGHVVREVLDGQNVIIPMGAQVNGTIEKLIPTSDPTDRARLLIRFAQLQIPGHAALDLGAHLAEVENAREKVLTDGTIQGVLEKEVPVSHVDNTLEKLGAAGGELEKMSDRTFGKVDTSIDFPPGTDMTLMLDSPLAVDSTSPAAAAVQLSQGSTFAIQKLLSGAPQRAESKGQKPGDPLNLIVIGSEEQIRNAFKQAGWSEAESKNRKSVMGTVRAMASEEGFGQAPVSQLYLYERPEDLAFEKMLNTFFKRHHLRLWRSPVTTADGREIWLGASTHDIGLDIRAVSHAIDSDLDAERSKVGADLIAGGLVAAEQLVSRPNPLSEGKTATGGTWKTDGQMLAIELRSANPM